MRVKVGREWRDIGPGAAGGVDGLSAAGRLSAIVDMPSPFEAGAMAPIERREASAAQRAAWRTEPVPGVRERKHGRFNYTPDEIREHSRAGGEANRRRMTDSQRAAFGTGDAPRPPTPLVTLADPPVIPEELPVSPCPSCSHEPVCGIKNELRPGVVQVVASPLHEALQILTPPTVSIACSFFLAGPPPAPPKRSNGAAALAMRPRSSADPAGLTIGQRRVLDSLVKHGGDLAAVAAELGLKATSVDATRGPIRNVGGDRLTAEEAAVVAAKRPGRPRR